MFGRGATRRVATDAGTHDCDYLVVALGADYDIAATPVNGDVNPPDSGD